MTTTDADTRLTDEAAVALHATCVPTRIDALSARVDAGVSDDEDRCATVLLHGAAGSWRTWTPLLAAAIRRGEPLSDVVALDLPGWGESGERAHSVPVLSAAVVDALHALGYRRWRLVGHSFGGFLALDIAARNPESTVAVGLVSPSGGAIADVVRRPWRGAVRLPGFAGMLAAMTLLHGLGRRTPGLLRGLERTGLLRLFARPLFHAPGRVDRSVTEALADEVRPAAFLRAAHTARIYDDRLWRRIACPVVSVSGDRDVFSPASDGDWFARRIPRFTSARLAGSGHFSHVERPDAVLDAFDDVWTTVDSPAGRFARPAG